MPVKQTNLPNYFDLVQHTLSKARIVNLFGDISLSSVAHMANTLDFMIAQDKRKPIEIRLNTPGGSVIDGLAIYDAILKTNKTTQVNITVTGACMSMGVVVLQAARVRRAYTHSQFLLHEIGYGSFSSHSNQKDLQKQAERLQTILNGILVDRSLIDAKTLKTLIERRDYTISAQEALKHGLIDEIVE